MLVIKNNIMAANAARHLGQSYDSLAKSVERLSSGLRINSSKDDAAGLAVRELMRADIAVIQQGVRNAQDGISMMQTMEGALQTVDNALVRMKQLAEQAATGSYSDAQRLIMDSEFKEMASEINRIATSAKFNNISLLNATSGSSAVSAVNIVFGGATDYITVDGVDMTSSGLGVADISIKQAGSALSALALMDSAIAAKDTARATFGYKMSRLESTVEVLSIQAENLQASESRISDVDVAGEVAAMTRNQVLAQAGIAMLTQANAVPQMALTLLR
jgi:flagellin